jgi:two-component system sensor histidine kinase DesK
MTSVEAMGMATDERDHGSAAAAAGVPSAAASAALVTGPLLPGEGGATRVYLIPRIGQPGKHKWMFAAVWLIYLIGPLVEVAQGQRGLGWKTLNFAVTVLFAGLYCLLSFVAFPTTGRIGTPMRDRPLALPLVVSLWAIAFVSCLWINPHLIGMWVYVGTGAGLSLPLENKLAQRFVLAAVAGVSVCSWATHLSAAEWLSLLFPTFFAGLATIGIRQMAVLIGALREAREQVAQLAANEERLRLARDLHDLTGHSLSMITLKAELAQRLVQKAVEAAPDDVPCDPRLAGALKEVTEIEQVSRQTLTDIREAVSGYRRPTLAVELTSASAALEAAGIKLAADSSVVGASGSHDPELEGVLAWCLREAVTNVIRHSGATRVRVRLAEAGGELALTVWNDGRGLAETAGAGARAGTVGGNGLAGLRERLDAVGGRLAIGGTDGDFRVVATVPVAVPQGAE